MFSLQELETAAGVVHRVMAPTPHYAWPLLAARTGCEVWVKHENHTPIGAFKLRGGLVFLHQLMASGEQVAGLITATRGNHGQSIALAGRNYSLPVIIYVPQGNSVEKNRAMEAFGAELVEYGVDFDEARVEAGGCLAGLTLIQDDGDAIVLGVAENHSRFRAGDPATLGDGEVPGIGLSVSFVDYDPVRGRLTVARDIFSRNEPLEISGPLVLDRRDIATIDKLFRAMKRVLDGQAPSEDIPARLLSGEALTPAHPFMPRPAKARRARLSSSSFAPTRSRSKRL